MPDGWRLIFSLGDPRSVRAIRYRFAADSESMDRRYGGVEVAARVPAKANPAKD